MPSPRRLLAALCLAFAFLALGQPGTASAAPGPVKKGAVTAELVAPDASIQPGRPFLVALKLTHEPTWHSYWINPGTGYPTSLRWTLPDGFTAGDIIWPLPHVVQDTKGNVTGHGYEGTVFLFVEITPPATLTPGTSVTLRAAADWLMCAEVCMPGDAQLELTRPVKAEPPGPDMSVARVFNNARAALPQPLSGWTVTAARADGQVTVQLRPAAGTSHRPTDLHLFDTAGLVDYAAPQQISEENGVITFLLTAAKDGDPAATRLSGVIASGNGWGPLIPSHGASFDVPLDSKVERVAPHALSSSPAPAPGPQAPPSAPTGLLGTLLLALMGGLVLNLMPCVFPVLGIKVLGFVNQSGSERSKVVAHGLVFTFGVLLSFWVLAGAILALRAAGNELGWGAQLQYPAFNFALAAFLLVFALNLSGLFEVGLAATGVGGKLQMRQGYAGSFFTGALAVLVATPCSAPFLAPALGAAFSKSFSAVESMAIFTAIGVGLAVPYLLLSAFPAAIRWLPRPGAWMETFKQFLSFLLYATVGWLVWVLSAQINEGNGLLLALFGFTLIAMAAWAYGRFGQASGSAARRRTGIVAALLLAASGLWLGWPRTPAANPAAATAAHEIEWTPWSPEAVAAARTAGRTVYVDFTARWCFTCQTNKAVVFGSGEVLDELRRRDVLLLKADWTNKDPAITAELAKWNRSAVPFNLIYAPGRDEPIVLPELLTPGTVLDALHRLDR